MINSTHTITIYVTEQQVQNILNKIKDKKNNKSNVCSNQILHSFSDPNNGIVVNIAYHNINKFFINEQ